MREESKRKKDIHILLKYLAIPVCAVATFAAVQEGHFIRTDRSFVWDRFYDQDEQKG